jgi:hypothetical protein
VRVVQNPMAYLIVTSEDPVPAGPLLARGAVREVQRFFRDLGTDGQYLVYQIPEGESLRRLARRSASKKRLRVFAQLAGALRTCRGELSLSEVAQCCQVESRRLAGFEPQADGSPPRMPRLTTLDMLLGCYRISLAELEDCSLSDVSRSTGISRGGPE